MLISAWLVECFSENHIGLKDIGKIPHSNDKLIRFAKGILIVLPNSFNNFVEVLLGPIAFLLFRLLIISWISSGSVGVRKKFNCRGSVRKSEKFLLVIRILPSRFCAMV